MSLQPQAGHTGTLSLCAYRNILEASEAAKTPIWCSADALPEAEFDKPFADADTATIEDALSTIEEHHPGERVWIESVVFGTCAMFRQSASRRIQPFVTVRDFSSTATCYAQPSDHEPPGSELEVTNIHKLSAVNDAHMPASG